MEKFDKNNFDKFYKIIIQGSITDKLAEIIVSKLNSSHQCIKAKSGNVIIKKDFGESEIILLSTIASGIAATISGIILLYDKFTNFKNRKKWNVEKLIRILNDNLITKGITDYRITNVSGFQNLTKNQKKPCVIIIEDVIRNNIHVVTIFSNEGVFITEIE